MSLTFSDALRNARANSLVQILDQYPPGTIELYVNTQPAPGGTPGDEPVAIIALQDPCGTVSNGVLTFATTPPVQVLYSGTLHWARLRDGLGRWLLDGNVAVTGTSGAAFTMDNLVLFQGAFVFLYNATLTEP